MEEMELVDTAFSDISAFEGSGGAFGLPECLGDPGALKPNTLKSQTPNPKPQTLNP